jgi:hypothetical protein
MDLPPAEQPAPAAPPAKPAFSKAAIAALVFSLLGLAFFPLSLLGLILGGVGLAKTRGGVRRGRGVAILALVLAPFTVVTTVMEIRGAGSGPWQTPRMLTLEARTNLASLTRDVKAAQAKTGKLPPALPPTPSQVPCGAEPVPWPQSAAPGWRALGFSPTDPVRYSYEYAPDPDGKSFTVRARGDLNCDGKTSLFEARSGQLLLHIEDELE